jgi:hypothetical protein
MPCTRPAKQSRKGIMIDATARSGGPSAAPAKP